MSLQIDLTTDCHQPALILSEYLNDLPCMDYMRFMCFLSNFMSGKQCIHLINSFLKMQSNIEQRIKKHIIFSHM